MIQQTVSPTTGRVSITGSPEELHDMLQPGDRITVKNGDDKHDRTLNLLRKIENEQDLEGLQTSRDIRYESYKTMYSSIWLAKECYTEGTSHVVGISRSRENPMNLVVWYWVTEITRSI